MGFKRHKPIQEFSSNNNLALDKKLRDVCVGLRPSDQRLLLELKSDNDREMIADFIRNWSDQHGQGWSVMSPASKRAYITSLVYLSRYLGHKKSFSEMTKEDILDGYLAGHKRELAADPDQKWVNTYRTRATKLLTFWKWLTQPDLKPEERQTPLQLKGLRFPKRNAKTSVKREQLWTPAEHKVFLDRVEDLRLACYHAIALECGGRPSELLALKIKDIQLKTSPSTGKKYAEFYIGQFGKSKKARPATISDAIPYLSVWR